MTAAAALLPLPDDLSLISPAALDRAISFVLRWDLRADARAIAAGAGAPEPRLQKQATARIELLLLAGDLDGALELAQARAGQKLSAGAAAMLVDCLLAAGQLEAAEATANDGIELFGQTVTAWCALGRLRLAQAREEEARQAFTRALELRPGTTLALEALADCGPHDETIAYYEQAVARAEGTELPARLMRKLQRLRPDNRSLSDQLRFRQKQELDELLPSLQVEDQLQAEPAATVGDEAELAPASDDELVHALQSYFGHDAFRPGQREVIESVLSRQDTLALMPTGGGKSLCYQLPAMLQPGTTLVLSPLVALMKDQIDSLPEQVYAQSTAINSSLSSAEVARRLVDVRQGRYKLVYVAPERLRQRQFVEALKGIQLALVVIDEAHCVSMWGHDFRPDYLFIGRALEALGRPPLLAMTATATEPVVADIQDQLGRSFTRVSTGVVRPNLRYEVIKASNQDEKKRLLLQIVNETPGSGIVYATARNRCEELAGFLVDQGISAAAFHAKLDTALKTKVQEQFMLGQIRVVVATVAFGMGIDKSNIRFIAHFNLPRSVEAYTQESGRAGRDGRPSRCSLLFNSGDVASLTRWMHDDRIALEPLRNLYGAVKRGLAGQEGASVGAAGLEQLAGRDFRVKLGVLERAKLIERSWDLTGGRLDLRLLPAGDNARERLEQLLQRMEESQLRQIDAIDAYVNGASCRQRLLARHFGFNLEQNCGACDRCQAAGRRQRYPRSTAAESHRPLASEAETERFERLRAWRHVQAERDGVPDYLVFPDTILRELARVNPKNWRLLRAIAGGDAYKLEKFGDDILRVLSTDT